MKKYIIPTAKFISVNNSDFICMSLNPTPGDGDQLSKEYDFEEFEEDAPPHKTLWD